MRQRGRKSAAALAVVAPAITERPEPPKELTAEEAEEWRAVVDRMPPDWFPRETHGLLVQYCRHRIMARRIAALLPRATGRDLSRLAKDQREESKQIEALARAMRLSQHSRYDKKKTTGPQAKRPWEASPAESR